MNILTFVLATLLILSLGTAASFQKHAISRRSQAAFIGLRKAERNLLRQSEIKTFKELQGTENKQSTPSITMASPAKKKPLSIPAVNPACCRLNLFPLIEQGKENQKARYELAAKMLKMFYSKLLVSMKRGTEFLLLDAIIEAGKRSLKDQPSIALETLTLPDPDLQPIYYLMLKGTKRSNLFNAKGYPPLIDFLKIERLDAPICLFHAHPHMLASFFGLKATPALYEKLHQEIQGGIEIEALLLLVGDPQLAFIDPEIWTLLDCHKPKHKRSSVETLVAEDQESGIAIRSDVRSANV